MNQTTTDNLAKIQMLVESGEITEIQLRRFLLGSNSHAHHTVQVDYDEPLSKMVRRGEYGFNEGNMPCWDVKEDGEGVAEVELELLQFGREMNTEEILVYLDDNGLRPANYRELLTFVLSCANIYQNLRVICLDKNSSRRYGGEIQVPYMEISTSIPRSNVEGDEFEYYFHLLHHRSLYPRSLYKSRWLKDTCFLAVFK